MQRHDTSRRLLDSNIGDRAGTAENTDASAPASGEGGHGVEDVGAGSDFEDVGFESVGCVSCDYNRWFWFVLGSCWSSSGSPDLIRVRVSVFHIIEREEVKVACVYVYINKVRPHGY